MTERTRIPIIDLFAGPGGLGEGFSVFEPSSGADGFRIALSIEMDHWAHQTLALRAFYHSFPRGKAPVEYYAHLRGELARDGLFAAHPDAAKLSAQKAWKAELGKTDTSEVDRRIRSALGSRHEWVLCGGPPCQAFSVVGRSRTGGISAKDHRVYLYLQYLRILAVHEPPVFIMENVKGLISSQVKGSEIFRQMLTDLRSPGTVVSSGQKGVNYNLYSLVLPESCNPDLQSTANAFIVKCEDYGVPQCRHRVIILGVRSDVASPAISGLKTHPEPVPAKDVLCGLPRLRSGLSRTQDGQEQWQSAVADILDSDFMRSRRNGNEQLVRERVVKMLANMRSFRANRGDEFIACTPSIDYRADWFLDPRIGGACNHTTRPHMAADLHRYLFVAAYAKIHSRSPELKDFPVELHPQHKNMAEALSKGYFDDRFRVQIAHRPATTITSHIAKDGHYFIHYDETQCRSLTVREAARLQTFPDNYFFCGPRTHQYRQVGNAVPPLLASQIASIVYGVLTSADTGRNRRTDKPELIKVARYG